MLSRLPELLTELRAAAAPLLIPLALMASQEGGEAIGVTAIGVTAIGEARHGKRGHGRGSVSGTATLVAAERSLILLQV